MIIFQRPSCSTFSYLLVSCFINLFIYNDIVHFAYAYDQYCCVNMKNNNNPHTFIHDTVYKKLLFLWPTVCLGHYKMADGVCVCLFLCPSHAWCWEWKGLGSPKLTGWKPVTRVTFEHCLEVKRSPGRLVLSQTMHIHRLVGIPMMHGWKWKHIPLNK